MASFRSPKFLMASTLFSGSKGRGAIKYFPRKVGMPIEEYRDILGNYRQKLFDITSRKPWPHLDDMVIVSWNGLEISSFARASKILKAETKGTKFNFPVVGCNV